MSGELYKHYEVLKEIGAGGFSRVYRAVPREVSERRREEHMEREGSEQVVKADEEFEIEDLVAIKVVRSRDYECELRDVAENEVAILQAIAEIKEESNHLVQLISVFREPRRVALVMEYLDGGELFERIVQRGKYSEMDASNTMSAVIRALDALHRRGIVHRDLKPENLVYKFRVCHEKALKNPEKYIDDREDCIKLMDFGLSKFLDGKDPHHGALYVGTPGYIAPEVLSSGKYSSASDIFSMGVILYILLSGRMPFGGKTSAVINSKILSGSVAMRGPAWEGISERAKTLIKQMLVVDPKKRISAREILAHPWMIETKIKKVGTVLFSAHRLKRFYESYKFGDKIKKVLASAHTNLRSNLYELIDKAIPMGFTLDEISQIKEAFLDENHEVHNPDISRSFFRETMIRLGFEKLPLDDIFDALMSENESLFSEGINGNGSKGVRFLGNRSSGRKSKTGGLLGGGLKLFKRGVDSLAVQTVADTQKKNKSKRGFMTRNVNIGVKSKKTHKLSMKNKKAQRMADLMENMREIEQQKEEETIKLDELLVGLSTVAAMESTETFIKFLVNLFNRRESKTAASSDADSEKPGITSKALLKLAKVVANYRADDDIFKRDAIAKNIGLFFSYDQEAEDEAEAPLDNEVGDAGATTEVALAQPNRFVVSLEDFQTHISCFLTDYLAPLRERVSSKVQEYRSLWAGRVGSFVSEWQSSAPPPAVTNNLNVAAAVDDI